MVRAAFAAVAEVPGAEVRDVRQKCGILEIRAYHPDETRCEALRAVTAACTEASRSRCEGCGAAVPPLEHGRAVWRLHCPDCLNDRRGRPAQRAASVGAACGPAVAVDGGVVSSVYASS